MSKPFDMELFLSGVLTGSHASRLRHIRQAKIIHMAIYDRWQLDNPWTWRRKHLTWLFDHHLEKRSEAARYYYRLTVQLITSRLGGSWPPP